MPRFSLFIAQKIRIQWLAFVQQVAVLKYATEIDLMPCFYLFL